ncbi:TonB-dependent receptor plug domain-containing protein [Helicobacter cynogastricus]|uniref:TonB-dependent receptor plug domain-containing protein n=1 Tax=Helicobacter cynogastricus TaxID=329937 RepID=UPI000CF05B19|nr:TonB-dependent receptor plug domain-containing protein [Helicobacter cynogastricus]
MTKISLVSLFMVGLYLNPLVALEQNMKKQAEKPPKIHQKFKYNNTETIKRKELQQRQSNEPSDLFKTDASINTSSNSQTQLRGLSSDLARVSVDGAWQ